MQTSHFVVLSHCAIMLFLVQQEDRLDHLIHNDRLQNVSYCDAHMRGVSPHLELSPFCVTGRRSGVRVQAAVRLKV